MTVADLIVLYGEKGADHLKDRNRRWMMARLRHHVVPLLGRKNITEVRAADVEQFMRDVKAGKTAKDEKAGLRARVIVKGGAGADPLFPSTLMAQDEDREFRAVGLERRHCSTVGPVRRIFEAAFTSAGLPYFHPHSFRHTLGQLGQRLCRTSEEMKAWSQNLGHEQVLTTLTSYGHVEDHRQGEIIQDLARAPGTDADDRRLLERIKRLATHL